jgi:hypothetical protein
MSADKYSGRGVGALAPTINMMAKESQRGSDAHFGKGDN